MARDLIGFRRALALRRDRIPDPIGQAVAVRIECEVVIDDVDGDHTEGGDRADQLDAVQCETLAESLRSTGYGKKFMWGSETKHDSVSQT